MKKIIKRLALVMVIGLFVYTIFFLYEKSKPKPIVYNIEQPFFTTIENKTVATGKIVPRKEVEIKPRASGIISELYVEPGDLVKVGKPLAKIKIVPDMISLNNAESRLDKAKIAFEDAQRLYNRQKQLFDQKVIAVAEMEQAEVALKNAKAELQSAEDNLKLIREGISSRSSEQTNTLVTSTIEGMVLSVPVEVGNSVIETNTFNAGTTIAIIANMSEMIFVGKVDESEVGKLTIGMPFIISVGAIADAKFDAILEYISPKGTEESGAVQFEIKAKIILNPNYFIRSGYSATAEIVLERKENVLAIKESLLKFESKTDSVFVEILTQENPQQFEKRPVKLGISDGVNVEIIQGLETSDKIKGDLKKEKNLADTANKKG
ncbi:MAG TPA: efflux RND transporter periplasmic adaptor subunit [Salinivirgaceae bacterium]|nr:efflux RND transporter periplasmic adaptor subunit [Salinivirgaceae bacterium]